MLTCWQDDPSEEWEDYDDLLDTELVTEPTPPDDLSSHSTSGPPNYQSNSNKLPKALSQPSSSSNDNHQMNSSSQEVNSRPDDPIALKTKSTPLSVFKFVRKESTPSQSNLPCSLSNQVSTESASNKDSKSSFSYQKTEQMVEKNFDKKQENKVNNEMCVPENFSNIGYNDSILTVDDVLKHPSLQVSFSFNIITVSIVL